MIEKFSCRDLAMYRQWLDSCNIDSGILLLYDIDTLTNTDDLYAIVNVHHLDTIFYNKPGTVTRGRGPTAGDIGSLIDVRSGLTLLLAGRENHFDAPANTDVAVGMPMGSKASTLFINSDVQFLSDLNDLMSNSHFVQAIHKYGYTTTLYRSQLLQGGDILWVGHHLFVGKYNLQRLSPRNIEAQAEESLRKTYGLKKSEYPIDFIISHDSLLYHLDLYFTYAGRSTEGREQFFIGCIDTTQYQTTSVARSAMKADLDRLYKVVDNMLSKENFDGGYNLDRVPIFLGSEYFVSPMNGVLDCVNGNPMYYLPYPVGGITGAVEVDSNSLGPVLHAADSVMSARVAVKKIWTEEDYMSWGETGGGQSLHCMMSVIRRQCRD